MTDVRLDKPRAKWLLAIAAISTLLLVILLALGVLGGDKKIQPGNRLATGQTLPNTAKTLTLSTKSAANTLAWQGTVRSRSLVKITPKLTARILEIPVHAGDHLKPGQVIARLDQRDLQAAYNAANSAYLAAQAQAAQAKSEEVRITALYNQQAATRQNYEAVLSQAKSAQAIANQAASAAQQTQVMLGENSLYAPFDGVVAERFQEPGDMASPNQAVVSFLKPDDLRLELAVADNCTAALKLGLSVTVRVDGLAHRLIGKVDEISPEIDAQTRSQPLKISLPKAPGLQHGQLGWLELACQAEQAMLLVPASAIIHYGQLEAVQVLENSLMHTRHIRTGKQVGEQFQVLSGLHAGETIVINGAP